jgi:hypothetical protein
MGSLPFHQKESIALFFMIFGWNFGVRQYFEAQKPYFGNFWGIGSIEFDESGMAGMLSWICVERANGIWKGSGVMSGTGSDLEIFSKIRL